jgi:hypothetical protein
VSKKIASVPYEKNESFDFYEDKMIFDSKEIKYNILEGYGYLLTNGSTNIYGIPASNSTSFDIRFSVGGNKTIEFSKSTTSAMLFKGEKHDVVGLIYIELVKCIEAIIAPYIYQKLWDKLLSGNEIMIGGLTISIDSIRKKSFWGEKEMVQYGQTIIGGGFVTVKDANGKIFHSSSLCNINAPLLKPILDNIFLPD